MKNGKMRTILIVTMPLWWAPMILFNTVASLAVFFAAGVVKEGYEMIGEKPPQWSIDYSRTSV